MILTFWISLVITLVIDLATKIAFPPAPPGVDPRVWLLQHDWPTWISPAWNTGVAWSMFDSSPWAVVIMTLILIPLLCVFYWRAYRGSGLLTNLAFGLIIGGAVGNAWDRIAARFDPQMIGVRDWIHVDLNIVGIDYIWPTFNIADSGICVGFIILLILSWLPQAGTDDQPAASTAADAPDGTQT